MTTKCVRLKSPAHPGGFVRSEIIDAHQLTVTDAARALGVTRAALSALLIERAHLSAEMALRIEKALGISMDALMRIWNGFDIAVIRKREGEIKVRPFQPKQLDPRAAAE